MGNPSINKFRLYIENASIKKFRLYIENSDFMKEIRAKKFIHISDKNIQSVKKFLPHLGNSG